MNFSRLSTGHQLKFRRIAVDLTQADLSIASGIPSYRISLAERNRHPLNSEQAQRVDKILESKECAA